MPLQAPRFTVKCLMCNLGLESPRFTQSKNPNLMTDQGNELLRSLLSVTELLKNPTVQAWLEQHPHSVGGGLPAPCS